VFPVRVSPGGLMVAPNAPPDSDNAPATPNTVTAFVRRFRFEFRLPCDMVEASHLTAASICNHTTTTVGIFLVARKQKSPSRLVLGLGWGEGGCNPPSECSAGNLFEHLGSQWGREACFLRPCVESVWPRIYAGVLGVERSEPLSVTRV
jgi:hypothetical protein